MQTSENLAFGFLQNQENHSKHIWVEKHLNIRTEIYWTHSIVHTSPHAQFLLHWFNFVRASCNKINVFTCYIIKSFFNGLICSNEENLTDACSKNQKLTEALENLGLKFNSQKLLTALVLSIAFKNALLFLAIDP